MKLKVLFTLLFVATAASAQTTSGNLFGTIVDTQGQALPGATVTLTGAGAPQVQVTDAQGRFRYLSLTPGSYKLGAQLEGFSPTQMPVTVNLGRNTEIDLTLNPAVSEQITVSAVAPVLDTNSTSVGSNLDSRSIDTLPTGRNYSSIVQVVPGVTSDANPSNPGQSTISVYGSSGAENAFFVDGVNTTNMEYGFQGKELNFEFIQEVDVKTGGYEAEFGRATGGIVNVITKSGSNQFRGDVFGYYDSDSAQSNAKDVVSTGGTTKGFTRKDYGADLGGYIIKDKLWFFGAYDSVRNSLDSSLTVASTNTVINATSESRRSLGSAKLTWNAAPSQSVTFTFLQDPRADTGAINDASHTLNGDPSTYLGRQDFGGHDYALRYDGAFASSWILTGQVARHEEANSVGPASEAGNAVQLRDVEKDFFQRGGFGLIQKKNFERMHYGGSLLKLAGNHEIKGGLEFEHDKAAVVKRMSGGQQIDVLENKVNPAKPIYRHFYWTTPDATIGNAPFSQLNASPEHKVTTAFLQDRWSVNDRLVLNYGVRWDKQEIIDASGVTQITLDKDYAPRLGFVFDPSGNHTAKIYGSIGRYYEEIPMDLVIRSFSYERQPRIINYDPASNKPDPNAEKDADITSAILGGFTEPSDPNLENQYINEFLFGYEREVRPNLAVGVKGIYRNYGQVIEDFLCADDGTYCIGNPGEGIMKQVFTLDYSRQIDAPKPKRTYKGVQVDATKRFSNNWQGLASYLYSRLDGNFDGEYAPFTNVGADPNISAAYDYYDFFTNGSDLTKITNSGPLSNDRRHQFKVSGVYETPYKLSIGLAAYWRSGTPITRYGYSDAYGRYEFFLTKRGAEGRTPSNYDADIHLGYPIATGKATVNLLLDVFNVLNTQRAVLIDQRWGFEEADNASLTPVNKGYGQAALRTPPLSARLGVRISF